ncbi:MAG: hypothetical protein WC260_00320 [Candidatus Pacearchaeota archaeon]
MAFTTSEIINQLNNIGFFSYVIPFLLIFAVVYAILEKSKLLGDNNAIKVIISIAIGLLALQFNTVSYFFANIFPKFGVGLAIFLVIIIFLSFFYYKDNDTKDWIKKVGWIGWVIAISIVLWALTSWNNWFSTLSPFYFLKDYIWGIIVLGIIVLIIYLTTKKGTNTPTTE